MGARIEDKLMIGLILESAVSIGGIFATGSIISSFIKNCRKMREIKDFDGYVEVATGNNKPSLVVAQMIAAEVLRLDPLKIPRTCSDAESLRWGTERIKLKGCDLIIGGELINNGYQHTLKVERAPIFFDERERQIIIKAVKRAAEIGAERKNLLDASENQKNAVEFLSKMMGVSDGTTAKT